ncbi:MAG: MarR family transcriptional regulator [Chloroflexota bacterium]|nr:MarR family transcriptional regulator [Acidimicrobiia bacterium]MDH3396280.1 MarR family transcriptional regulator [Acidimicrobiia bacterium]MDH3571934.1 MarR family transcriptional regulator [Gemmatimonadota bacterium]MDH4335133.1 MarR family transcriptional regulator [Chloroflexota bacterium]
MAPKTNAGVETAQMEAFGNLMRAQAELVRRLDDDLQTEAGLSLSEYVVLLTLRYAPDRSLAVGDLTREVHLSKSGVTRLVDRMEKAGTIERVADTDDRRFVRACITEKGRGVLRTAWPIHRRGIDEFFGAHLSEAEAKTLSELLRKVTPAED